MNTNLLPKEDESAIRKLMEDIVIAFNKMDMETLLSYHSDNIILMDADMPLIEGKEKVQELFQKFEQQKINMQLTFTIHEIEVWGKRAFVRGQVIRTTIHNDASPVTEVGKFICLLQKQEDGQWLRTHVIANND